MSSRVSGFATNATLKKLEQIGMARDAISARGKSRWICQAIRDLCRSDPGLSSVGVGEALEEYGLHEAIVIDPETDELITKAFKVLRSQDPRHEGVQASLIRAAIRYGAKVSQRARCA